MQNRYRKRSKHFFGIVMILPALILIGVLIIYPLCQGVSYSFTSYKLNRPNATHFVGLANYIKAFTADKDFLKNLGYTLQYTIGVVAISYVLGFFIAQLLNANIPMRGLFRALVLIPWVISSSVSATNWQWLLNERYGFVNLLLQKLGIIDSPILFFAKPELARITVTLIGAWKSLPFMTIIVLAGLQSIPTDQYEAAAIDGAGKIKSMWYITIPGLKKVTVMCTTLQLIWTFNNFDQIFLLTGGGPNKATYTLPVYIYQTAFEKNNIAYASAMAVLILLAMAVITFGRMHLQRRQEEKGELR